MKNILFIICLSLVYIPISSQTNNLYFIKKHYPEIYISILNNAEEQSNNSKTLRQQIIDEQSKAFLDIMDLPEIINNDAMTDAIINNSLPGSKNHNIQIINDLSIEDPFPLFKCDWSGVYITYNENIRKFEQEKNSTYKPIVKSSNNHNSSQSKVNNNKYTSNKRTKEDNNDFWNNDSEDYKVDQNQRSRVDYKEASSDFGLNMKTGIYWLQNTGIVKSIPGFSFETGLSGIARFESFLYIQGDLSSQLQEGRFEASDYSNTLKTNIYYLSSQLAFHFGSYKKLVSESRILGGIGPFARGIYQTNAKQDNVNYKWDEVYFTFGITGMFAIEKDNWQFGLYPNIGLFHTGDHFDKEKPLNILIGVTYWVP